MNPYSNDPHMLSGRPGFLLRRAHQVAVALFADEIGHLDLTPPQHNALSAIKDRPGTHQTELSRVIGYDRATVGALIVGLERRGLITRVGSPLDKRLKISRITPKGTQLLKAASESMGRISERIVEPLSEREREVFIRLLAKVALSPREFNHDTVEELP
jgi:DNA-binding MarR family transcriptional regulator